MYLYCYSRPCAEYCFQLSEEHTPPAIEAPQLGLMFTGILLRELAQIMLAWCSEGEYDTPSMKPTSSESGNYVEEAFFGGVIGGWWKRKEVGNFAKLFKIIIAYRKGVRSTGTWEIGTPVFAILILASNLMLKICPLLRQQ